VAAWSRALPDLAELLPDGGAVVVALDSDWRTKPAVHEAAWNLMQACHALGYGVEVALWDKAHKGIDDLVTAGLMPDRRRLTADMMAEIKERPPGAMGPPPWSRTHKLTARMLMEAPRRTVPPTVTLTAVRAALPAAFATSRSP
jgi:hypothetical protein